MKASTRFTLVLLLISGGICGGACVSVNLGDSKTTKAKDYRYKAPSHSFEEVSAEQIDHGWRERKSGNTISVVSDCTDREDPSLSTVTRGVISGIEELKVLSQDSLHYNGREALRTKTSGKVDGLVTLMDIVALKKNGCIYVLSYVGLEKRFSANLADFDKFLAGFEAP